MKKTETKRLQFAIEESIFEKLNKICAATNETKTDVFRRLINNELAQIEGRPGDVVSGIQSIVEQKINDIHTDIKNIFNGVCYVIKNSIQGTNLNTRLMIKKFEMSPDEVNPIMNAASESAGTKFKEVYKTIVTQK